MINYIQSVNVTPVKVKALQSIRVVRLPARSAKERKRGCVLVKTYVDYFLPFEQLRGMLLGVMWARDRAQPGSIEELDDKIKELQAEYDHRKNLPDPDKKEIDLG